MASLWSCKAGPEPYARTRRCSASQERGPADGVMAFVARKGVRVRAAIALAAFYALCILSPSAAFAFGDGQTIAHCLADDDGFAIQLHPTEVHGAVHHHVDASPTQKQHHHDDGDHLRTCCGLFGVAAIVVEPAALPARTDLATVLLATIQDAMSGRQPGPLDRPPIS